MSHNYLLPHCVNFQTWTSAPIATTSPQRDKRRNGLFQVKVIQWAADLAKGFGAYVGVVLSGLAAGVPEQGLNIAQIGQGLQQCARALALWCVGAHCCNPLLGAVASSAFGPTHCCKVLACCQWTSGTQNPARLFALGRSRLGAVGTIALRGLLATRVDRE
jgi:hypothetical protein